MLEIIQRSVRLKMMMVVVATTFMALLVSAVALVLYEAQRYKSGSTADLITQAELVGNTAAPALVFDDPQAAKQNLDLLRARPRIVAAAIYTAAGAPFASYVRDPASHTVLPVRPGSDTATIRGAEMWLFRPIRDADGRVGTVYLRARYELMDRIRTYLAILAAAMVIGMLAAALMSYWLQAAVTEPILSIARVAHDVKASRDLSLRARKTSDDEIGELADTFNDMVEEVGQRTEALELANASLEQEMGIRREAEQALRVADQRKDEFLATLAHELRNPLAPLRTALEILRTHPDDGAPSRSAREIMNRQLLQLVRLVDDLLDVSRITTGKLRLRPEPAELGAIVQMALDAARPSVEQSGAQLKVFLPEGPVELCVDGTRLAQVLQNLLHNAAKFTPRGGEITLRAGVSGDELMLAIADNGIGIPPDKLPMIFEMFEQVDRSLERRHSGLGVGLSLSRRLIELHGGTLEAKSEGLGKGSTFIVRMPRSVKVDAAETVPVS